MNYLYKKMRLSANDIMNKLYYVKLQNMYSFNSTELIKQTPSSIIL